MFGGGGNQNKNVFGESNFGQAKNPGGLFGAGSKTDSKSGKLMLFIRFHI